MLGGVEWAGAYAHPRERRERGANAEEISMTSPIAEIMLLADRPELAVGWAGLHLREWGGERGREALAWWVADAERATVERARSPVAFVAVGRGGEVLGGVGLHEFDLEERRDRSPWVVGTIV